MTRSPENMFSDTAYDGWEKLSAREKVERMLKIHKDQHEEGEDVSS
jgi:hypothetical protein